MTLLGGQSRDALRESYVEAWKKSVEGRPLTPLEVMIVDVIGLHPEYQALLGDSLRARSFDPDTNRPHDNPFLHMGLHLAVREQVATDRPAGIREVHVKLCLQIADRHAAEHQLMQVLGQVLWDAQRSNRAPDEGDYLVRARALLRPQR